MNHLCSYRAVASKLRLTSPTNRLCAAVANSLRVSSFSENLATNRRICPSAALVTIGWRKRTLEIFVSLWWAHIVFRTELFRQLRVREETQGSR